MEKNKLIKTVNAAQKNDDSAISLLYSEYAKSVYRLAFKLTGSKEEAEDVMQNVFMAVLGKIKELRKPEAFESWLNKITANCCNTALKNRLNTIDGDSFFEKQGETETILLPEPALDAAEASRIVSEAVDALPLAQKTCVYYHYYQGLTAAKIAEAIGENIHTVKSRINLAKKKIRAEITRLEKEYGVKLHGTAFIIPSLKLSMDSIEVPCAIINSIWDKITTITSKSVVKIAAGGAASAATGGVGLKLAVPFIGIILTVGVGIGLYLGTDIFNEVTPEPVIETVQTDESTDDYLPEPEIQDAASQSYDAGNTVNYGIAAMQDDWIYYSGNKNGIYKIKTDGTEKECVTDDKATFINVSGDWIYYCNSYYNNKIYKIRTDGTERQPIEDGDYEFFSAHDLSAFELLGYYLDENGEVWIDSSDWEECPRDVFREYMFGSWLGPDNGEIVIDDSEKAFGPGPYWNEKYLRRGDTIIYFYSSDFF